MTFRLPKDLLNLVFWEIESGYDLINFSELNRKCHQIFHQNLEVVNNFCEYRQVIYTQQKLSNWKHGVYRIWNQKQHYKYYDSNYFHGEWHGVRRQWYNKRQLWYEEKYLYGKLHGTKRQWDIHNQREIECNYLYGKRHGIFQWYRNGQLDQEEKYHYGNLIEK